MKKLDFTLLPMQNFLTKDVDLDYLIEQLDAIYYQFTEMAMKESHTEQTAVLDDVIANAYWIKRLKEVFKELK